MDDLGGLSHYPVGVVDCKGAIRMNRRTVMLSQSSQAFVVSAPKICTLCNSERDESSPMLQKGIIMTNSRVCETQVEIFKCSNCRALIHSEGRDHKIVLASLLTAATHVLLRYILRDVATSNGTLRGRLEQYLSDMTARIEPDLVAGQSLRTDNVSCITKEQRSQTFMEQMQLHHDEGMLTEGVASAWGEREVALQNGSRSGTEVIGDVDSGWFGEERRWRSS